MKVAFVFGTTAGATEDVVDRMKGALGVDADALDVSDTAADALGAYDVIIAGTPTYEEGELQEDWIEFAEKLSEVDLSGKKVALFGLGDQEEYPEDFVSAMAKLHALFGGCGAELGFGFTDTDGYTYEASDAVKDGKFCGLVLDEDNQDELTDDRIGAWITRIKGELGL